MAPQPNTEHNDMTINRYEPFRLIKLLNRDLDRLTARRGDQAAGDSRGVADWTPAVDILERKDRFVLRADLPGVGVDAIDVRMEDGVLTLSGERTREADEEIDGVRRFERSSGRFLRRFSLPESADAEQITARSTNGILEVSIPKQPEAQPRRITVEAA